MTPVLWEWLTWEEVGALRRTGMDMAILPVGSTEQHGPHLSLNVDTVSADAVARAVSGLTGVPVLPALPYGAAWGHTSKWPGTLSLSPATVTSTVVEIGEWLLSNPLNSSPPQTRKTLQHSTVSDWEPDLHTVFHAFEADRHNSCDSYKCRRSSKL